MINLPEGLPSNAYTNLPIVLEEVAVYWPDMPDLAILPAQVEQETCISLKHKKCWSRFAELRTNRERGVGLGQVTKTKRFDTLADLKRQYPSQFSNWSWDKPYNARYQARGLVLMDKFNWGSLGKEVQGRERLAMMLNQYNAGPAMLARSRASCRVMTTCLDNVWFENVERAGGPSAAQQPGYRKSFYTISREYIRNIYFIRSIKYQFLRR